MAKKLDIFNKLIIISTFAFGMSATLVQAAIKDVTISSKEIKWVKKSNGVSYAQVWGDSTEGVYGQLVKVPAGYTLKNIHHTNNLSVVVNSGKLFVTDENNKEKDLEGGSFFVRKAKTKYSIRCDKKSDCVFFVNQSGMKDFNFSK